MIKYRLRLDPDKGEELFGKVMAARAGKRRFGYQGVTYTVDARGTWAEVCEYLKKLPPKFAGIVSDVMLITELDPDEEILHGLYRRSTTNATIRKQVVVEGKSLAAVNGLFSDIMAGEADDYLVADWSSKKPESEPDPEYDILLYFGEENDETVLAGVGTNPKVFDAHTVVIPTAEGPVRETIEAFEAPIHGERIIVSLARKPKDEELIKLLLESGWRDVTTTFLPEEVYEEPDEDAEPQDEEPAEASA
jgi:hypothetical protein